MTQELRPNRFKWKLLLLWVLCSKVNILIANIWIFPNKHSDMALQRFKWKYGVIVWFHIRHGFHWWYDIMPKDFTFIPRDDPSRLLQWLVLCIQGSKFKKLPNVVLSYPQSHKELKRPNLFIMTSSRTFLGWWLFSISLPLLVVIVIYKLYTKNAPRFFRL